MDWSCDFLHATCAVISLEPWWYFLPAATLRFLLEEFLANVIRLGHARIVLAVGLCEVTALAQNFAVFERRLSAKAIGYFMVVIELSGEQL